MDLTNGSRKRGVQASKLARPRRSPKPPTSPLDEFDQEIDLGAEPTTTAPLDDSDDRFDRPRRKAKQKTPRTP